MLEKDVSKVHESTVSTSGNVAFVLIPSACPRGLQFVGMNQGDGDREAGGGPGLTVLWN